MSTLSGNGIIIQIPYQTPNVCERYKGRTQVYNLPVLSGIGTPGGPLTVAEYCERRYANIVDNQLLGAIEGHRSDGYWQLGNFGADIAGERIALDDFRAFIESKFVENLASQFIIWDDVDFSAQPYLFVSLIENSDLGGFNYDSSVEFGDVATRWSTNPVPLDHEIILGRVISGNGITVDKNVPNRKKWTELQDHIFADSPHGGLWRQDTMTASGVTVWGTLEDTVKFTAVRSGEYGSVPGAPGVFDFHQGDWEIKSGVEIRGSFLARKSVAQYNDTKQLSQSYIQNLTVDSGLKVYSETNVYAPWEFSNSVYKSGIGFSPINKVGDWPVLTSTGKILPYYDPSLLGAIQDDHIASRDNPHIDMASGLHSVGILSIFGDTLQSGLEVSSGISVDGIDLSYMKKFITSGIISANDHQHLLLAPIEFRYNFAPYDNVILSGMAPGYLSENLDFNTGKTYYGWSSFSGVSNMRMTIRDQVPIGARELSGIDIFSRIGSGFDTFSSVGMTLYDCAGNFTDYVKVKNPYSFRGQTLAGGTDGIFPQKDYYRIVIDMVSEPGVEVSVSDIIARWVT